MNYDDEEVWGVGCFCRGKIEGCFGEMGGVVDDPKNYFIGTLEQATNFAANENMHTIIDGKYAVPVLLGKERHVREEYDDAVAKIQQAWHDGRVNPFKDDPSFMDYVKSMLNPLGAPNFHYDEDIPNQDKETGKLKLIWMLVALCGDLQKQIDELKERTI